jgi:hypothetical protein
MIFSKSSVIGAVLAAGLLSGCDRLKSNAGNASPPAAAGDPAVARQELAAAGEGGSPHFNKVVGRLDVGGRMLHFQDHEGQREFFTEVLKAILGAVPEMSPAAQLDPARLVDATGVAQAAASGRSLIRDGDAWLMRGYQFTPGGPQGLSQLLGKEAFEFTAPAIIPAASDLVVETRLDATVLPGLIQRVCEASGNAAAADQMLSTPMPQGGTAGDLMAATRLHLILAVDVSSWDEKPVLPKPVDYFVRIAGAKPLLPVLLPELEKNLGKPAAHGTRQGWELPLPAIGMQTRGVLLFDDEGTLTLASRGDYLKFVDTAAMKLGEWKEYQASTNHFPATGNFLLYASPQAPVVLGWVIRQVAKDSGEEAADMIIKATEYLQPRPLSLCVAHEADGIAVTAELPFAAELDFGATLPVLSATSTLFVGARAWKKGSDRAACMIQTRNIQQAVRAYQTMNGLKPGAPVPWDQIFGPGKLLPARPSCLPGTTYTYAKTFPAVGKLACTCSDPEHVPGDHQNW